MFVSSEGVEVPVILTVFVTFAFDVGLQHPEHSLVRLFPKQLETRAKNNIS